MNVSPPTLLEVGELGDPFCALRESERNTPGTAGTHLLSKDPCNIG